MANPATASDLGAAIKAIKKQVKVFSPNVNAPGHVSNQRGNDQRQINAAGRQGGHPPFNTQQNNHYNRRRHHGCNGGGGRGPGQWGCGGDRHNNQQHNRQDDGLHIPRDIFQMLSPKQCATYYEGFESARKRGSEPSVDTRHASKQTCIEPAEHASIAEPSALTFETSNRQESASEQLGFRSLQNRHCKQSGLQSGVRLQRGRIQCAVEKVYPDLQN
jgi:hypothetical protein